MENLKCILSSSCAVNIKLTLLKNGNFAFISESLSSIIAYTTSYSFDIGLTDASKGSEPNFFIAISNTCFLKLLSLTKHSADTLP